MRSPRIGWFLAALTAVVGLTGSASGQDAPLPELRLPLTRQTAPDDAAVVIGIGQYVKLPLVPYAREDAQAFHQFLLDTVGVSPGRTSNLYAVDATKEKMEDELTRRASEVRSGGTLWVYFAGHGVPASGGDAFLVGADAEPTLRSLQARSVRRSFVTDLAHRPDVGRLVLDACFSGKGRSGESLSGERFVVPGTLRAVPKVVIWAAAAGDQVSGPLDAARHGLFSYFAIGAMSGWADLDRGEKVSLDEASRYVEEAMAAALNTGERRQTPVLAAPDEARQWVVAAGGVRSGSGPDLKDLSLKGLGPPPPPSPGAGGLAVPVPGTPPPPRPEVGMLRVEGSPAGARVDIQGPAGFGRSGKLAIALPYGPETVPSGEYRVTVSAPGYDPSEQAVRVRSDRTEVVRAELVPAYGTLDVTGSPVGARVEVMCAKGMSQVFGLPWSLPVPRGTCAVSVRRDGYRPFERTVEVAGGKTATVAVRLEEDTGPGPVVEWVRIPGGTFDMGSNAGNDDEKPVHRVTVGTFEIARTEVTVGQYRKCVEAGACTAPSTGGSCNWGQSGREDHPANCVDWNQAKAFRKPEPEPRPPSAGLSGAPRPGRRMEARPMRIHEFLGFLTVLSSLPSAFPAPEQELCPAERPLYGTWRFQRGYGQGSDRAAALRQAEEDARTRLLESVRDSLTDAEYAEIQASVDTTWVAARYDPASGLACAVAIVARDRLDERLKRESEALDAALARLAGQITDPCRSQKCRVRLETLTWADGRPSGELGHRLAVRLHGALSRVPNAIVVEDVRSVGVRLGGAITVDGGGCRLQAWIDGPASAGRKPLDPVRFHPNSLGLRACDPPPPTFASDERIGLSSGTRAGASGLRVSLSDSAGAGMLCEGREFDLSVTVSGPAFVQLYSVGDDGTVLRWWESARRVEGTLRMEPRPFAIRLPEERQSRIVAVAWPAAGGPADPRELAEGPLCVLPKETGFRVSVFPARAAIATLTHGVWLDGRGQCPPDPAAARRAREALEALGRMPACPGKGRASPR